MTIAGRVGAVFLQTEAAPVAFANAGTTADATRTIYTLTNDAQRYLDKNTAVSVFVNAVLRTTGFSVEHIGGVVRFLAPLLATDVVTVSGSSVQVTQAGGFFNWSAELAADVKDVTTFASAGWKEHMPTVKGFTASAESYWANAQLSQRLGQEVIVALYLDTGTSRTRYEGYAILAGDSIEFTVDDVVNESIEFEGSGNLYYRGA